jgi:hypothetical protein
VRPKEKETNRKRDTEKKVGKEREKETEEE